MARLSPGKALAQERAKWVRDRARAELVRLSEAIRDARTRRKVALARARQSCRTARERMRSDVKAYRSAEMNRINEEVRRMRQAARAQCQARTHRISVAGGRAVDRKAAERREQDRLRVRLESASRRGERMKRSTAKERREEDDDAVRSNLPAELLPVFERVRKHIKGSLRRTRTEAFLEWAEEHPEDVIDYQGDATEREVRRLIAEHEATGMQLRKTGRATRRRAVNDVPF